jgi:hypothetical protein
MSLKATLYQRYWTGVPGESHRCEVCGTFATSYWELFDTDTGTITRRFSCAAHEQEARTG